MPMRLRLAIRILLPLLAAAMLVAGCSKPSEQPSKALPDPATLLRIDTGQPGQPLSLTKPIGTGVLNAWHKATGEVSAAAIDVTQNLAEGSHGGIGFKSVLFVRHLLGGALDPGADASKPAGSSPHPCRRESLGPRRL